MASKDGIGKTLIVALVLCVLCSIMVSTTAIILRPEQKENQQRDVKKNILTAAGLMKEGIPIEKQFEKIEPIVVDLKTGQLAKDIDPKNYDMKKIAKDPNKVLELPSAKDIAGIKRRVKKSLVYLVRDDQEKIEQLILPVHGKGLWSTMYGFLALSKDTKTVKGFAFYEHGETPGLGGEVDNEEWKKQWIGKQVYNDEYEPILDVVKGSVEKNDANAYHQIDGLSGATITANGVENTITFWLGEYGYHSFLENFRNGEIL